MGAAEDAAELRAVAWILRAAKKGAPPESAKTKGDGDATTGAQRAVRRF